MSSALHVCARCPKALGASCCEVGSGEQLATLTSADVERISEATGLSAGRFCETEWLTEDEARTYERQRPLYAGYFGAGPERLTLRRKQGACVFLDRQAGCTLSAQARPRACLLYPFEKWPDGSHGLQVDRYGSLPAAQAAGGAACLAVEEAESMEEVLGAFGTTREKIEALCSAIQSDVAGHAKARRSAR